jgi:hypothetical protein
MGTAARAGVDNPSASQLELSVLRLKEQLSLIEQQTQELDKIFHATPNRSSGLVTLNCHLSSLVFHQNPRMYLVFIISWLCS